jgi:hypothetical protein
MLFPTCGGGNGESLALHSFFTLGDGPTKAISCKYYSSLNFMEEGAPALLSASSQQEEAILSTYCFQVCMQYLLR